ncbi:cytochrome d ubiquinol oxidase subunit II [Natrialba chahannaoensis JCM 10990]|uniref:Cytochrome d ubiquinol oxidase subunit II n=1 Tax=Natrialba chahannaoensis JCM 10990 TaxID=1227492 RepID=M0AG51_9EURY|nr:cytochrome d ubiquinol oxidase subunit II [Natrialba chahannaoensis]ELY97494.1 cytochrome d ubiquinol oxidase subunit II [Natrialba chahannaoensis JCM 10990]
MNKPLEFLSPEAYVVEWLPLFWFALVFFSFGTYLLLDGFDFGIGMLYARATPDHREVMLAAFGPVWKANEVWLVLFGTVLFAGFPVVYANLLSRHYLLVFALLAALICRAVGSKLRDERDDKQWQRTCDGLFVGGSLLAPFLIGMFAANWRFGLESTVTVPALAVGTLVVVLSLLLGSAFMGVKARGELQARMRRQGRWALAGTVLLIVVTVAFVAVFEPGQGPFPSTTASLIAISVTLLLGTVGAIAIQTRRHYVWAAVSAAITVTVVGYLAWTMVPAVDPAAGLLIDDAVVSPLALELNTLFAVTILPIVVGYFVMLYSVFSGPVDEGGYGHS